MKKLLFATLCFACLSISGIYAQTTPKSGNESATSGASTTRQGKGVSKGTPLIQQKSSSPASGSGSESDLRSEEAAPAAPASGTKEQSKPVPTNGIRPIPDSLAPVSPPATTKPKEAAAGK
jgi:hypothetical protein